MMHVTVNCDLEYFFSFRDSGVVVHLVYSFREHCSFLEDSTIKLVNV